MPELPEVETTRRGVAPHIEGRSVQGVTVRNPSLRQPVRPDLRAVLLGRRLIGVLRRAKYLLLLFEHGQLIIHLGMSGSLRLAPSGEPAGKHDHVDIDFGACVLRYRDPRRFGLLHWQDGIHRGPSPLDALGIEPLDEDFDGPWLHRATRRKNTPIKQFLMDARQIVGIGNIYASESLFQARIDPRTAASRLGPRRCARLAASIRATLEAAITAGGSTLRDFTGGDGKPGYFQLSHAVYDRHGQPCPECAAPIRRIVMGQRSTFFCPRCQRS